MKNFVRVLSVLAVGGTLAACSNGSSNSFRLNGAE